MSYLTLAVAIASLVMLAYVLREVRKPPPEHPIDDDALNAAAKTVVREVQWRQERDLERKWADEKFAESELKKLADRKIESAERRERDAKKKAEEARRKGYEDAAVVVADVFQALVERHVPHDTVKDAVEEPGDGSGWADEMARNVLGLDRESHCD